MTSLGTSKPGLRERKKAKTRAAIQDAALRLYLEQGYAATTVEQIAEAAEVSQSTFFRYFPTKPETVLYDRLDPLFFESFIRQPAELTPVAALRAAFHEVLDDLDAEQLLLEQTRWRLVADVPELRASVAMRLDTDSRMFTEALAERVGRTPDDFAVTMLAGALLGAMVAAFFASRREPNADIMDYLDRAMEHMEAGPCDVQFWESHSRAGC